MCVCTRALYACVCDRAQDKARHKCIITCLLIGSLSKHTVSLTHYPGGKIHYPYDTGQT